MTLWLVRHARPLVAPGVCYGASDIPADAQATAQAAQALAAQLPPVAVLQVWYSPLQRASALAQALQALRPGLLAQADPRLAEMDFGRWEGRAWDALERAELDAWTADFAAYACGGGECVQALMERVAAAYDQARACAAQTVWLTHAGVIRAAQLLAAGQRRITRADQWPMAAPGFGEWLRL